MYTCPLCQRSFKQTNQKHYCANKNVSDFLAGKTDVALTIFDHLIAKLQEIGPIKLHATKAMLVISSDLAFAYIITLGKSFVDVVLPFDAPYNDNLCFRKVGLVPGTSNYNHHLRLMNVDDFNEEVIHYLTKAYANGKNL